jgi:predicted DNA-binding ribbon-helix-helix protein
MEESNRIVAEFDTRIELGRLEEKALRRGDEPIAAILRSAITMIDRRIAQADESLKAGREPAPPSSLISRNIKVRGHRTSVRLEAEFWRMLEALAQEAQCTLHQMCEAAVRQKGRGSATSAIRVFVLRNLSDRMAVYLANDIGGGIYHTEQISARPEERDIV